jgi:hypothetical protein
MHTHTKHCMAARNGGNWNDNVRWVYPAYLEKAVGKLDLWRCSNLFPTKMCSISITCGENGTCSVYKQHNVTYVLGLYFVVSPGEVADLMHPNFQIEHAQMHLATVDSQSSGTA